MGSNGKNDDKVAGASERERSLAMALGQIDKQFGKGAVMRLGDHAQRLHIEAIPTGSLGLDIALGVGGLPRGRVVELFGPESSGKTTVALHVVAEAQKLGGVAAFIDAEHALDPVYAGNLGVDIDSLLVSQPDTGEQALEIADMLIRSNAIDVLVVDSVAALVPRAEIEGEMGDTHVGLQARLMSQALRKLTGSVSKSRTCVIFINQIREKIGVMFGCFSYSSRVTLADGSQERIGKIVNQRRPVEVLSYNIETGRVEPRKVVNWFRNGKTDHFLQFMAAKPTGNGKAQFAATPNHLIRTLDGWRQAGELHAGDRVLIATERRLSEFQLDVIRGSLMGDGCLSRKRRARPGAPAGVRFRLGHGKEQAAYLEWKVSLLGNVPVSRTVNEKGAVFADFTPLAELGELRARVYGIGGKKELDWDFLKALTPRALAIWYMDDGHLDVRNAAETSARIQICVQAMSPDTRERLVTYLRDTWDLDARLTSIRGKAILRFSKLVSEELQELVAPFVHPSMEYKLLPAYRGRFEDVDPDFAEPSYELMPTPIIDVHPKPLTRSMQRFDIEVEGNHCYFVDGVLVHNSPETTPGGRALKFYSSIRLDVRRVEAIKDGAEMIGNRVRAKVVKNKCVAEGTTIFDPTTGLTHRIEDVVDHGEGTSVFATDKLGQFHVKPIADRMDQGMQDVIGVAFRGGTVLWVTPDHKILTDGGWREAGELRPGDWVARPRRTYGFGDEEPVAPDQARLLGYLIGDGYVGGKTPIAFINAQEVLREDVARIADGLGCRTKLRGRHGLELAISHRIGEQNGVLALARWAGIWGHLAPEKRIPAPFFAPDCSEGVVANLLFGIWESDGWISREQTGAIRCGFVTTSEQLANQIHWLLLRWGIGSSIGMHKPGERWSVIDGRRVQAKLPCWQVRVGGIDNVVRFAEALPMWGPRGQILTSELSNPALRKHRGSQRIYLPRTATEPVLAYLRDMGVTTRFAAQAVGLDKPAGAGMRAILGASRLRRDRVAKLADALESEFLSGILNEDVYYARVKAVEPKQRRRTFDLTIDELHNFVADDVVVHNCAPPFRTAEFDLMYSKGISKEGSLLDVAVEYGIVKKSGAWFTYEGDQLGQGRENAKEFLTSNADLAKAIEGQIREIVSPNGKVDPEELEALEALEEELEPVDE